MMCEKCILSNSDKGSIYHDVYALYLCVLILHTDYLSFNCFVMFALSCLTFGLVY